MTKTTVFYRNRSRRRPARNRRGTITTQILAFGNAADGQLSSELVPAGSEQASGVSAYEYDLFNQLTKVVQGQKQISYTYQVDGLRQSKTVNDERTTFAWNGSDMIKEWKADGAKNTYLYGIDGIVSKNNDYYLKNAHGDVSMLVNQNAAILSSYQYDAFGNQKQASESDTNPFRYAGEYFDDDSGMTYLRARYYQPGTGRFINEDPAKDGMNWYSYCAGNPVNCWDPNGLEYIVVSGGKYNNGRADGEYNYEFIEPAIKKLRELKSLKNGEGITWMITADGWSENDKAKFYEVAGEIGVGIQWIESKDDFINYINNKSDGNRASDPIRKFLTFSHGYDFEHTGWTDDRGVLELGAGISISVDDINNKLWATAFDNPNSWFGSCNLGTAGDRSFAQAWANKFGGTVWAFVGKSDYQNINQPALLHPAIWASRQKNGFSYYGSANYPVAGTTSIPHGPWVGGTPFMMTFTRK